ncbi:uncharacterized protein PHALS_03819 [Plasmopara halstedii]|uniref:Uncharacterized protein n=1 Tax=Plasmopara halstedii TaxID=4781 RepID=A0A0P1AZW8_PLAHL|nr:uncharacterized protein PHALS_03819 [Plasmopara halstedii]CEG47170.1 hypothetical protein PHALS_03819 [Plasmopara halstedii]|eukprot:XP_024583539.1 hypothetical protein PHALS_03819 [Plasmopara halstedii]
MLSDIISSLSFSSSTIVTEDAAEGHKLSRDEISEWRMTPFQMEHLTEYGLCIAVQDTKQLIIALFTPQFGCSKLKYDLCLPYQQLFWGDQFY